MSFLNLLAGFVGQRQQDKASALQAQKQMDFQREMSSTAVQRRMADLKAAGINPILAGSKEASSPGGAMAPMGNRAARAMEMANSAQALKNAKKTQFQIMTNTALASSQTEKTMRERDKMAADVELARIDTKIMNSPKFRALRAAKLYSDNSPIKIPAIQR